MTEKIEKFEPGCYFDSHRGHYIVPAIILFAKDHGYIVDPFLQYALDRYENDYWTENYPTEALIEEQNRVQEWLNQIDGDDRIKGQNFAPARPEGYFWDWNDGDFGLYESEEEE